MRIRAGLDFQIQCTLYGLHQNVTELEQQVTAYGNEQGDIVPPLNDNASVAGDVHTGTSLRSRAQTARKNAETAERHRLILVERQDLALQRKDLERQKLEHKRAVELFRAEQAAAKAAHKKRLAERGVRAVRWRTICRRQRYVAQTTFACHAVFR